MRTSYLLCASLIAVACGDSVESEEQEFETLQEWGLFLDAPAQQPADDVVPFDVTSPLFTDGVTKLRFMHIPEGTRIGYSEDSEWDFPEGTVLIKTFAQPADDAAPQQELRLLETRLLVRGAERWTPHAYVWNEEQTEAERKVAGKAIKVSWTDIEGESRDKVHLVPNLNECRDCHGTMERLNTLGGKTRMLDMDHDYGDGLENQVDYLAAMGWLDSEPKPAGERHRLVDPFGDAPVSDRARAYLDTNCASCHRPGQEASQSGLFLDWEHTDPDNDNPANWGTCKLPTSAGGGTCGLSHDVVPGDPDRSIMICRLESQSPKVMMPPLGRTLVDEQGVALLREWIASMPANDCSP